MYVCDSGYSSDIYQEEIDDMTTDMVLEKIKEILEKGDK